jgi:hypothetical protein
VPCTSAIGSNAISNVIRVAPAPKRR